MSLVAVSLPSEVVVDNTAQGYVYRGYVLGHLILGAVKVTVKPYLILHLPRPQPEIW